MRKWLFATFILLCMPLIAAGPSSEQLERCLIKCYNVDQHTAKTILEKLAPLLENEQHSSVIQSFIEQSEKLDIYAHSPPSLEDARYKLLKAHPSCHTTLFENGFVKISWAETKSGEQEAAQIHPWKSLMIIVRASPFHSERADGVTYEDDWPVGLYPLEPFLELLCCKNIGPEAYNGLIFEIKAD